MESASDYFSVSREGSVAFVSLPLHVDSEAFDKLNESMLAAFARQPAGRWVLDLSGLSYMGSSVLGLMVNVRQRVRDGGGQLALCGMSPDLLRVFQTCSLERLFLIRPDRDEAVRAMKP